MDKRIVFLLSVILFFGCQNNRNDEKEPNRKEKEKATVAAADTIHLYRENGTLAPAAQFQLEWVITKNKITYYEKRGESEGTYYTFKNTALDWNSIRFFDKTIPVPKDNVIQDGADVFSIEFKVGGRTFTYPAALFESKVACIEQVTRDYFSHHK